MVSMSIEREFFFTYAAIKNLNYNFSVLKDLIVSLIKSTKFYKIYIINVINVIILSSFSYKYVLKCIVYGINLTDIGT